MRHGGTYHSHNTILVNHELGASLKPRLRGHPNAGTVDQNIQSSLFSKSFSGRSDAVLLKIVKADDGSASCFELNLSTSWQGDSLQV